MDQSASVKHSRTGIFSIAIVFCSKSVRLQNEKGDSTKGSTEVAKLIEEERDHKKCLESFALLLRERSTDAIPSYVSPAKASPSLAFLPFLD